MLNNVLYVKKRASNKSKWVSSELPLSKTKWIPFCIYRPPEYYNLKIFFQELKCSLSKVSETYENITVMGDFKIEIKTKAIKFDKFDKFCDVFNLTNLIKSDTCIIKTNSSTIELQPSQLASVIGNWWRVLLVIYISFWCFIKH